RPGPAARDCRTVASSLWILSSCGSQSSQVLDARANVEYRSVTIRRLRPGDGGVLLEHEPALVARLVQCADHLGDPRVTLSERSEQPLLRRFDERQFAGAYTRGDLRVHVFQVDVHDPVALAVHEL